MPSVSELSVIHYMSEIDNFITSLFDVFMFTVQLSTDTKMRTLSEVAEVSCAMSAQAVGGVGRQHKWMKMRTCAGQFKG